jgi:hypothetical protein
LTAPTSSLSSGLISSRRKSSQQTTSSASSNITSLHNYYSTKTSSTSSGSNSAQTQPKLIIDHSIITANKDKVYQWILNQSKEFKEKYFSKSNELNQLDKTDAKKSSQKIESSATNKALQHNNGLDVLDKLKISSYDLDLVLNQSESDVSINEKYFRSLKKINNILHETDISSFEMIHSGLIEKLFSFLNVCDDMSFNKQRKLQSINLTPSPTSTKINPCYFIDLNRLVTNEFKVLKLKQFLNVFLNLPLMYYTEENNGELQKTKTNFTCTYFSLLVSKLHNCVNQLEQYAVRVHDVPNSIGYGKTAIKFFNTHQIKCLLQRHPSAETALSSSASTKHTAGATSLPSGTSASSSLRQWKGGNVKIDPLAVVGTIEKYLLMRGIHKAPPQVNNKNIFFFHFYFMSKFLFLFLFSSLPHPHRPLHHLCHFRCQAHLRVFCLNLKIQAIAHH